MTMIKGTLIIIILFFLCVLLTRSASAQVPGCPQGYVCITQEAANRAAANARTIPVLEAANAELKTLVDEERKNTEAAKETARKNENDLRSALTKAEVAAATATGQLIGAEASVVRLEKMLEFLQKNGRNKCGGFTFICVQ